MTFENKVVFITGANGGLARAFINKLLSENVKKIYCSARDISSVEDLKKLSSKIETVTMDITDKSSIESVALNIENIDILINNAGVNSGKRFFDDSLVDFEVNLFGTHNVSKIFAKKINENGAVVNISSILALINLPIMALYCASKSALHSLIQALRAELQKDKISVFEVLPGPIDTNMTKGQDMLKSSPNDIVNSVIEDMKNDILEIYPDDFSKMVKTTLKDNPKALEEDFAKSLQ